MDAQGKQLDAGAASSEEEDKPEDDCLEVLDITDDHTGAVGEGHDDASVDEVGRGVRPGAGNGSNEQAGGVLESHQLFS